MAITLLQPFNFDSSKDYTFANVTATANISSLNANLGNLATANYFSGNGSLLSGIKGSNITGQVSNALIAGTVYTNAQPNITSVGTLASLTVTGLVTATAGGIKVGNLQDPTGTTTIQLTNSDVIVTGDITAGASGTGNVTATYFIGNGSLLTGLPESYSNANVAAYLPTFTGNLSAGNLVVTTTANLGAVGNITITGGSPNYVLSTDGAGSLSWKAQTGGGGGSGDSISNGASNVSIAVSSGNINMSVGGIANIVTVTNSGVIVSGNTDLGSNANVSISGGTTGQVLATDGDGSLYWSTTVSATVYQLDDLSSYTDGVLNTFMLAYNQNLVPITDPFGILVTINGAVQSAFVWNTDVVWQTLTLPTQKGYTIINSGYITFADPPPAGADIMVRTVSGSTNTDIRRYPFVPGDIMLG